MFFSITTYPFSRHRSLYALPVTKMPSFCTMAKECDIFSFELHNNMLTVTATVMYFNQRFVISSRAGVLHACLSPKRQNLIAIASGEKRFLFRIRLKDYHSGLIICKTK